MFSRLCLTASVFITTSGLALADTPPAYTVTDLGTLGPANANGTQALAINNQGQITGYSDVDGTNTHAFLYSAGTMTDLGSLGGEFAEGTAINDAGVVAGFASFPSSMGVGGFFATGGNIGGIGSLGGSGSEAFGINSAGLIVGSSETSTSGVYHSFIRHPNGSFTDIATPFANAGSSSTAYAINTAGDIVGTCNIAGDGHTHAFVITPSEFGIDLTPALTTTDSTAYAINNEGAAITRVVGSVGPGDSATETAVYFDNQTTVALGTLPNRAASRALAVNDAGTIVGFAGSSTNSSSNDFHAFIYRSQDATPTMVDLNTLIPTTGVTEGVVLKVATGINNAGQISAYGYDVSATSGSDRAYLLTPVTAPTPVPVPAAPTIAPAKNSIHTTKSSASVTGSALGTVTSVTYTFGKKKGTASGTNSWKFTVKNLKTGKNTVTVVAHGPGGDSATSKITIKR